jgi:hypothetical protein
MTLGVQHSRLMPLLNNTYYRAVNSDVWVFFFTRYGGGPVLFMLVPGDLPADDYANGAWQKKCEYVLTFDSLSFVLSDHIYSFAMDVHVLHAASTPEQAATSSSMSVFFELAKPSLGS